MPPECAGGRHRGAAQLRATAHGNPLRVVCVGFYAVSPQTRAYPVEGERKLIFPDAKFSSFGTFLAHSMGERAMRFIRAHRQPWRLEHVSVGVCSAVSRRGRGRTLNDALPLFSHSKWAV